MEKKQRGNNAAEPDSRRNNTAAMQRRQIGEETALQQCSGDQLERRQRGCIVVGLDQIGAKINGIRLGHFLLAGAFSESVWGTFCLRDHFRNPFGALFVCGTIFGIRLGHFLPAGAFSESVWGTFCLWDHFRNPFGALFVRGTIFGIRLGDKSGKIYFEDFFFGSLFL